MTHENVTSLQIPEAHYTALFEAIPGSCILLQNNAPDYTVLAATTEYLAQTGYRKEAIIGKGVFEMSPANPGDPADTGASDLANSLQQVCIHKQQHYLPVQRYDIAGENGSFSERYWKVSNKPVLSADGEVAYIIHSADNITKQVKASEREVQLEGVEKVFELFMLAPMVIGMVNGEKFALEMANEAALKLWGKEREDIIGKPFLEVLPELDTQGVIEIFNQVRNSGQPFVAHEVPVTSIVNGIPEQRYFNHFYQPYKTNGSTVTGVFIISHDVTEQVKASKKAQTSEENYATLFESMDQGYCTLELLYEGQKCVDYRYLETNPTFERHLGITNALGKTIRGIAPGIEPKWFDYYDSVALTGNPIRIEDESMALGKWFEVYAIRVGNVEERKVGVFFTDITGRKKTEEAIIQSENNLRNTILQAPVAMAIVKGPSFVVEIANDRMFELWGRGSEVLLNQPLFESLPEVRAQGYEEILTSVFNTGNRFTAQGIPVTVPRSSGLETVFIDLLYEAFREADGSIAGVMAVAVDVTDQVLSRKKIEESEIRFRTLADESPVFIFIIDADPLATVSYWNKTWLTYTGQTHMEAVGNAWNGTLHADDIKIVMDYYLPAFKDRVPYFIPAVRVRRSDGEYRWHAFKGNPRYLANGDFNGYVGMGFDIHEQQLAQQHLETALEQVRLSKEAAELGTFDLNLEEGTMHWDNRCRTLFGISHDNPVSFDEDFIKRLHPDDHDRVVEVIRHAYSKALSNGDYDVQYRTIGAEDGVVRWVKAKGKVYFDTHEKPVRFIGSVLDISEQVTTIQKIELLVEERTKELAEANESLLQANKELQRSNANLEEFAHAASHDLKEPIRKIRFYTSHLKSQVSTQYSDAQEKTFSRIENATERMANLIDDLLLYSQVSQWPHEKENVDLNKNLQLVLEDLELDIQEKGATINVGILPMVQGYKRQVQQLFLNLVSNALKYSRAGTPPIINITAMLKEHNNLPYHKILVQDNGIGFEPKYADKIFQLFTRLHSKSEFSGTGVGLSIVKKVVENHNGIIEVESEPGKGSTFAILFPV